MTIFINIYVYYYTEEQFKHKFAGSKEESTNFSIIHLNCRSLPSNYNKLKDCINALDFQFDVIALSETWLIDIMTLIVLT